MTPVRPGLTEAHQQPEEQMARDDGVQASTAGGPGEASLGRLTLALGVPLPNDTADEHVRWSLYQMAIRVEACHPPLLAAVADDPDNGLVAAVVVAMMERAA